MMNETEPFLFNQPFPSAKYISSIAKEIKRKHIHCAAAQQTFQDPKTSPITTHYKRTTKKVDTTPVWPPLQDYLSSSQQNELLDLYYIHIHPLYPAMDRHYMQQQLDQCSNNNDPSALWPLFFYSLFSMAAHYSDSLCHDLADYCLDQALSWHQLDAKQSPCIMTVLALTFLAKSLELSKKQCHHVTRTWKIADEIFKVIQSLGLYTTTTTDLDDDENEQERTVRILWAAFIYERFLGVTTGRPPVIDERRIAIRLPKCMPLDDQSHLDNFRHLIDMGKLAGRIMQVLPEPAGLCAYSSRKQAMLTSFDAWITENLQQATTGNRLHIIEKRLIYYDLLILLHKPFLEDGEAKEDWNKHCLGSMPPSHRICTDTAIVISDIICELDLDDLIYICKKPECFHALLTAARIHLLNTSIPDNAKTMIQAKIHFSHSMAAFEALAPTSPQAAGIHSLWQRTIKPFF